MEQKDLILQQARTLFFLFGIKSISMDDIALKLGMSKKTIYQYFEDKQDLLSTIIDQFIGEHHKSTCHLIDQQLDAIETFQQMAELALEYTKDLRPAFLYDLQKYYRTHWEKFVCFKDEHILEETKNLLSKGKEQGLFLENMNIELAAKLHICCIDELINVRHPNYGVTEIHVLIQEYMHMFLKGIASEAGLNRIEKLYNKKTI